MKQNWEIALIVEVIFDRQQSYYGNKPHGAYNYASPTFSMTVG